MATKQKGNAFLVRFLFGNAFFLEVFIMDFFPATELERRYVNTTTAIIIVLAVLVLILVVVSIILLRLYLKNRKRLQQLGLGNVKLSNSDLSDSELRVLSEYRELDEQGKELVNNTIKTLNSKSNK